MRGNKTIVILVIKKTNLKKNQVIQTFKAFYIYKP